MVHTSDDTKHELKNNFINQNFSPIYSRPKLNIETIFHRIRLVESVLTQTPQTMLNALQLS